MGTKWFTFYTKIRPWLVCLGTLGTIVDFFMYMKLYFAFWWLLLSLILSVAVAVLAIMVFVKSDYNYGDFVRFVKKVLLFEVFQLAYQQAVQQYSDGFRLGAGVGAFVIVAVFGYLIWYLLNAKYFMKRLTVVKVEDRSAPAAEQKSEEPAQQQTAEKKQEETPAPVKKARFCRHCGYKLSSDAVFCSSCGKKIEE